MAVISFEFTVSATNHFISLFLTLFRLVLLIFHKPNRLFFLHFYQSPFYSGPTKRLFINIWTAEPTTDQRYMLVCISDFYFYCYFSQLIFFVNFQLYLWASWPSFSFWVHFSLTAYQQHPLNVWLVWAVSASCAVNRRSPGAVVGRFRCSPSCSQHHRLYHLVVRELLELLLQWYILPLSICPLSLAHDCHWLFLPAYFYSTLVTLHLKC